MIISASRRTDIPSFYPEWFYNRIRAGFVYVRNPMNIHQVSRINLSPDLVDGFVFWTKNPAPMMNGLRFIEDYAYYFQFTVTPYGSDIEANIPAKGDTIIPTFQRLSDTIGPDRIIWRYDPIVLSKKYSIDYNIYSFEKIAKQLNNYTKNCIISFVDFYRSAANKIKNYGIIPFKEEDKIRLGKAFAEIADAYGLKIGTCAEDIELQAYGIGHASCVDAALFEKLLGCRLSVGKDKNQRPECGCDESIDIGAYNTCKNGCIYCYANYNSCFIKSNCSAYDPESPLLCSTIGKDDVIRERTMKSYRDSQTMLFD